MSSIQHAPNPTLADDHTASSIEATDAHLDVTILLLIISCYVNVLRIYVILFAYIHQFLLEISESDNPVLCPIPGLGFGRFPLRMSVPFPLAPLLVSLIPPGLCPTPPKYVSN
ncbi:hypothetical protein GGR55DRAFT_670538 [Xylaria sp. FL0064]|nr:hypothetical protein GGR55DRAFT_670538 [Xylaria sp. FL0064]